VDLGDWIVADLRALSQRLAGGFVQLVPPPRWTERADGGGIAPVYVAWHTARHHDVAVNGVLRAGAPEVLDQWVDAVGRPEDRWRGLAEAEDHDLVDHLDPAAVGNYLLAVIEESARWIAADGPPDLDAVPDSAAALTRLGTPRDRFGWLYSMWDAKPAHFFLSWEALGHGYNHLGELISIRNRLGLSPF
jgi:hypothetical protein